ncbi:MAG: hypothetical protein QNJ84_08060 [Alphaproteobacteria bacterium]|nr:hypothetical protein [Alphaproteobacteria bacterium]
MTDTLVPAFALIWAGVSLGGSLVAAPAKFRAPSLDLPTALEVGRAQFRWIGVTEAVLCVGLILSLLASSNPNWPWMAAPILIFGIQRLLVMPTLDTRTVAVINGNRAGETPLHGAFIALEIVKFSTLTLSATMS